MLRVLIFLAALAAPLTAFGQVVSERPDAVSIVVYPSQYGEGLAMVTERRTVDVPAGPSRISFREVAEGIVPQTVAVEGLPGGVSEQNFDFNLLTPASLMARADGQSVSLVRTNHATGRVTEERAKVVSSARGVVLDIAGRFEALTCSGAPERLVLDRPPPGFTDKPTLSVETVSPVAGRRTLTVSYLARGISWKANYVARLAPDGRSMNLSSWVTITNESSAHFRDAPVQVLAGVLQRQPLGAFARGPSGVFEPNCWSIYDGRTRPLRVFDEIIVTGTFIRGTAEDTALPVEVIGRAQMLMQGAPTVREDLGDYKLYTLPGHFDVAAQQTKQVAMFEPTTAQMDWRYRAELGSVRGWSDAYAQGPQPTNIYIELENKKAKGLGLPLPEGTVTFFGEDPNGRNRLVGEAPITNTAEGLPFEFWLGASPNVQARSRIVERITIGRRQRTRIEVTLTNANPSPVIVEVRETNGAYFKVVSQSRSHARKYGDPQWTVGVPGNDQAVVWYVLETRS